MSVRILSIEVSSKIAAGEVIERPASIIKELIENSIDAGATQIIIEARGGGINYICVSDNGLGIKAEDTQHVFQRYATSKISKVTDLETIHTLGFRGEALYSIAAVAEVQLITCAFGEETGSYLLLKDCKVIERGTRGCPQGTIITVRELFRHIPARLKFLKSMVSENERILDVVYRNSLAFPEIRFTLFLDERAVWRTSGNGNLRDVFIEQYGLEIAKAMLEVNNAGENKNILTSPLVTGLVSPSEISRANRRHITFFVNRRSIRSALLTRAVEEGYRELLMTGRYPIASINISVPAGLIDVNVHPAKSEVRFSNEQIIFSSVQQGIRQVLVRSNQVKASNINRDIANDIVLEQENIATKTSKIPDVPLSPELFPNQETTNTLPSLRVFGQIANCYIIAEGKDGLYLIDQHAAHERVLYEKIMKEQQQKKAEIQGLLDPVIVELNAQQEMALKRHNEALALFGFTIDSFGMGTYLIRAIPATLSQGEAAQVIKEILDSLEGADSMRRREEKIAVSVACHGVIRAGQSLTPEEMKILIRQLEQTYLPHTCPHGRPTMIHLSALQLAKEFGRSTITTP